MGVVVVELLSLATAPAPGRFWIWQLCATKCNDRRLITVMSGL